MNEKEKKMLELRNSFKLLLVDNPNYFGHLTSTGFDIKEFKPKLKKVSDTYFEEISCVSYNPESEKLRAIVIIKKTFGYKGGPCTDGSKEYVRFYVDYRRDGGWIDEGIVNFDAHDLKFKENLCYAVELIIDPKKRTCCDDPPVLPRVRAILSWSDEPPADQPDWLPVWGNHLEANIQIAPRTGLFCTLKDKLGAMDIALDQSKLYTLAESLQIKDESLPLTEATLLSLKKQYSNKIEEARLCYKVVHALTIGPSQPALLDTVAVLKKSGLNISAAIKFIQKSKFNTKYEEVKCIGLNRDLSLLHAGVLVKLPYGFSGNLCQNGSREYLAFYMDFGSGWEYMGTTSVRVNDVAQIPDDGLWYNAALPVSLTDRQKAWCETGRAKVKAILSWSVPPPPNDPDYVAPWGDWEQCHVEIRPLPQGVEQGKVVPVIESLGGMPVSMINISGYANGESPSGLRGIDSPFDGKILITGIIANAPDWSSSGIAQLQYRIKVRQPTSATYQPSHRKFKIYRTDISGGIPGPQVAVTQIPDSEGWMNYFPDYFAPDIISIDRNLLGVYVPSEEGLHELYVEIKNPFPSTGTTPSNTVRFFVDKKAPVVDIEITSGSGNCGVFATGDIIAGTFSISGNHCYSVRLSVSPGAEAHGATPNIGGISGPGQLVYGSGLPDTGTSGIWELDTSPMEPCGYNIRIRGEDRTIVDSRWFGRERWDPEGFCLE